MRLHLTSLLHDIIDLLLLEILSLYWSEIKSGENYSENSLFADTVRDTNLENVVSYFIVFSNFSNVSAHYYFVFFENSHISKHLHIHVLPIRKLISGIFLGSKIWEEKLQLGKLTHIQSF